MTAGAGMRGCRSWGDASFCADHGVKFAYMTGAMANGIASVEVVECGRCVCVWGVLGRRGLRVRQIEAAIDRLQQEIRHAQGPYPPSMAHDEGHAPGVCFNLIHSPNERARMRWGWWSCICGRWVRLVEAAAFLDLTLPGGVVSGEWDLSGSGWGSGGRRIG